MFACTVAKARRSRGARKCWAASWKSFDGLLVLVIPGTRSEWTDRLFSTRYGQYKKAVENVYGKPRHETDAKGFRQISLPSGNGSTRHDANG
jgi:hypothetical protein